MLICSPGGLQAEKVAGNLCSSGVMEYVALRAVSLRQTCITITQPFSLSAKSLSFVLQSNRHGGAPCAHDLIIVLGCP